jgi:RNA polymerase subunit RPABC4/transcription elongation factor Spt4
MLETAAAGAVDEELDRQADVEADADDDIFAEELGEEEPEELIQAETDLEANLEAEILVEELAREGFEGSNRDEAGRLMEDLALDEPAESHRAVTPIAEDEDTSIEDLAPSDSAEDKDPAAEQQICTNCGGLLRTGAAFCPSCGEQVLALRMPEEYPARSHCGVVLDATMRFCPECGEEVRFDGAEANRSCDICGATIRAGALFCPDCGQPVGAS